MSTRREVILSRLREKRQTGVCAICWVRLEVEKPAGAATTKDKHRRVITLSLVVSRQVRPHGSLPTIMRLNRAAVTAPDAR